MRSKEKVEKMVTAAKATLGIEGIYLTQEEEVLIKENLSGKISDKEFEKRVMELIKS